MTDKEKKTKFNECQLMTSLIMENEIEIDGETSSDPALVMRGCAKLYDAGYRKESEVVKEVLTKLLGDSKKVFNLEELTHYVDVPTQKIYDIAEKYGVKLGWKNETQIL